MKKLCALMLVLCLIVPAIGYAASKDWPQREIRVIVPYKEGGASHRTAMLIKGIIEKKDLLPEPMVVVCMPAAATLLGQEEVLKAAPDGYTLLIHHNAMLNNHALGRQKFTYKDFKPICQVYRANLALAARSDAPFNDLTELLQYIKEHPGKIKWTWAGLGGNTHFCSYLLYEKAGLVPGKDIVPVITKGDAESCTHLAGKLADVAIAQPSSLSEFVKAGKFKLLGQSSDHVMNMFGKDIKPFNQQGADYSYNLRLLFFAPKDTPDEITSKIEKVIKEVVTSPEYINTMNSLVQDPEFLSAKDATKAFASEAGYATMIGAKIKSAMAKQGKK
jgi:tripartite-type tricarboxylate transporter receptor subunit TctC